MIELSLMLRAIQSSFMVYTSTMAMQFSFKYFIVPKDNKSVDAKDWLVQPCKTEEYHLNIETLQLCLL